MAPQLQCRISTSLTGVTPYIAKIDIEGFEKDLFSKNTDWITLFPIIIIELHDWLMPREGSSNNFLRSIAQHDRDFLPFGENIISIAHDLTVEHMSRKAQNSVYRFDRKF